MRMIKAGLANRSYGLEFDEIDGLRVNLMGIFGDLAVYPIPGSGLFAGVRAEVQPEPAVRGIENKGGAPAGL